MSENASRPGNLDAVSPAAFPALRSFLRGYLHQDMAEESSSVEDAVRQFCEDADPEERNAVAEEWARFVAQTRTWPLSVINKALAERLGSGRLLEEPDLEAISRTFGDFMRR